MAENLPPDWARARAIDLANAEGDALYRQSDPCFGRYPDGGARNQALFALANYIAAHEQPPVDPLLECLRETFGGCAPEFFSAFKAALDWRGLEIVERAKGGDA